MTELPCVVLAGGMGTRLRSAVPDLPKCLAPVGDRHFLELQLRALQDQGVTRFVLSLGHMADAVLKAAANFKVQAPISCVVESSPLGTGGAVLHAMQEAGLEEAWVINGDTFIDASLLPMTAPLNLAGGEQARMAVVQVQDRSRYGGVEVEGTRVRAFVEKGREGPGLINAGLYRMHRQAFKPYSAGDAFSMETQLMPSLLPTGALRATTLEGAFIDIGVPEDYFRFRDQYASNR
jgi:D-glycero-alpha-D-manno-heptose 1-phosphate guanylyltransferase